MRIVRICEAKESLLKLVEAAAKGEHIGISRRGKFVAMLSPPQPQASLCEMFQSIETIRNRARKRRGVFVKGFINEARI